jgi:hypothetical protein
MTKQAIQHKAIFQQQFPRYDEATFPSKSVAARVKIAEIDSVIESVHLPTSDLHHIFLTVVFSTHFESMFSFITTN